MLPIYDSRSLDCRAPLGAVERGSRIRFRAYPESYRVPLRGYLVVEFDGYHLESDPEKSVPRVLEIEMFHVEHCGDRELFEATLDLGAVGGGDYIGLCFYHFRFENDGGYFRYGAREGRTGGVAEFYGAASANQFQLTVYDPHDVPDWFGRGITYQIFPDRFARSGDKLRPNTPLCDGTTPASRKRKLSSWGDEPVAHAEYFEGCHQVTNRDFFGGNLAGIRDKLDYLRSLGVTTLYLNPIFESFSNHRYNTADYEKIDPMLGSLDDFRALCKSAHERGMRVLLDGVFNHTGSDSVYFNRDGRYNSVGAYQSRSSEYFPWFRFSRWPNRYDSWWGIDTLPAVNEDAPSYRKFICESVVRRWLREGADGWRLDVADELPDDFIREISSSARDEKDDAFVIGEVWEDASNKISYSERRKYLLDGGLDAVMGYVFRSALVGFLRGDRTAEDFRDDLLDLLENYPPYAIKNSMNILGTHDTPRILTLLGVDDAAFAGPKENHGGVHTSPEHRAEAVALLKIASAVQFCFVGSPTVYYGDEVGMEGAEDPFCRRAFPWGGKSSTTNSHGSASDEPKVTSYQKEILDWYRLLARARAELAALVDGDVSFDYTNGRSMVIRRALRRKGSTLTKSQAPNGADKKNENDVLLVLNASRSLQNVNVPRGTFCDFATDKRLSTDGALELEPMSVRILVAL